MMKVITEWLRGSICKRKARLKIRNDTEITNFPLYCPKCKLEVLVNIKKVENHNS
ncbi:conjugal transfer protein [TM7 phylum sp. oral taxon 349]|nr:conjugal transfer protein [TM7 phylum sp. oral taxon 349]